MQSIALDLPGRLRELGPGDAPFPGTLCAGDPPTVWADAAAFSASPAWAASETEHVLVATDAARTTDGDRVAVPHCPLRLAALVDAGGADTPGAAVTVAISVLRGALEADVLDAHEGSWWVTASGRPLLALTGGAPWREEAESVLRHLATRFEDELGASVGNAADALGDPRGLRRDAEELERALFAVAAPGPLDLAARTTAQPAVAPRPIPVRRERVARGATGAVLDAVGRIVDRQLADRLRGVAASVAAVRSRARRAPAPTSARPHRRRAVLIAAAAGAAVVTAGVLWPAAAEPAPEPRPTPTTSASATAGSPESEAAATTPSRTPEPDDLVVIGERLIGAVSSCADECEALWEVPGRAASIPAATGTFEVEIVDEYGGVAALRVTGEAHTQIVVIVRQNDEWLVREVYDLADQP